MQFPPTYLCLPAIITFLKAEEYSSFIALSPTNPWTHVHRF